MAGVNQTVMMALAMVIFVALIGASGLGKEIWSAMRRLRIGDALEGGLAVVLLAIVLDRIGYALSHRNPTAKHRYAVTRAQGWWGWLIRLPDAAQHMSRLVAERLSLAVAFVVALPGPNNFALAARALFQRHSFAVGSAVVLLAVVGVDLTMVDLSDFPRAWELEFAKPIDRAATWMNINLAFITDPMRTLIFTYALSPIRKLLMWLPWPVSHHRRDLRRVENGELENCRPGGGGARIHRGGGHVGTHHDHS